MKTAEEIRILKAAVASNKQLVDDVRGENGELQSGIEEMKISWLSSQSEVDKLKNRNRTLVLEKESLELLVRSSHVSLIEAEGKLSALENNFKNATEELSCARQTIIDNNALAAKAEEKAQRSGLS